MNVRNWVVAAALCAVAGAVPGCGGSSSSAPDLTPPLVVATPTPEPTPAPVHTPTPPPCEDPCEPPVTNTNPPVRLTLRVYKVQDEEGALVEGIPPSIPLGYKVTIDATPKDANNRDTLGSGTVRFSFSDESLVDVGSNHGFQKRLTVLGAGDLEVSATLDGVDSNVLVITLG